ncbi:727_t:CDS:2 [Entrophospora sp. SA101]|nr:727_t:CDS:2 [Entrophospora sp. SA101]
MLLITCIKSLHQICDDLTSTQITPAQSTTPTSIATHTTQQLDQLQSTLWRIIPTLSTDLPTFQDQQPINSNNNNKMSFIEKSHKSTRVYGITE